MTDDEAAPFAPTEFTIRRRMVVPPPGTWRVTVHDDGTIEQPVAMRPAPVFWTGHDGETLALDPFYVERVQSKYNETGEWAWVDIQEHKQ